MAIPKKLQPHIDAAFPAHWLVMATVLEDGYAQISPRGSVQVYDDAHLSTWERGLGKTAAEVRDGSKVTFFYSNLDLRAEGMAFVRLYGRARVHRDGPVCDRVWDRLIEPERKLDPERKGFAVLVEIERVEDLKGNPIVD
jgi:general stress protein 26